MKIENWDKDESIIHFINVKGEYLCSFNFSIHEFRTHVNRDRIKKEFWEAMLRSSKGVYVYTGKDNAEVLSINTDTGEIICDMYNPEGSMLIDEISRAFPNRKPGENEFSYNY